MKFIVLSVTTVLFMPIQAFAILCYDCPPAAVPEPLSLALLGIGLGGIGAAELIRRHRTK